MKTLNEVKIDQIDPLGQYCIIETEEGCMEEKSLLHSSGSDLITYIKKQFDFEGWKREVSKTTFTVKLPLDFLTWVKSVNGNGDVATIQIFALP